MIVGMTLPVAAATRAQAPALGALDAAAAALCLTGIAVGCVADNQLWASPPRVVLGCLHEVLRGVRGSV